MKLLSIILLGIVALDLLAEPVKKVGMETVVAGEMSQQEHVVYMAKTVMPARYPFVVIINDNGTIIVPETDLAELPKGGTVLLQ